VEATCQSIEAYIRRQLQQVPRKETVGPSAELARNFQQLASGRRIAQAPPAQLFGVVHFRHLLVSIVTRPPAACHASAHGAFCQCQLPTKVADILQQSADRGLHVAFVIGDNLGKLVVYLS
jgi:hypothetical protein